MDERWWSGYPWRLIQTNLREIDMLDIDAEQFVNDLKEFKATLVMINTSGIIASYNTDLPYHFQSPYLQGDSLKKIINTCHESGVRVIGRTDFSKVRRPIYEKYPDWAYITPEGEIVDYNGDIHVCLNSEYQQKYMFNIIEETLSKLDLDGVFFNMSGYHFWDYSGNYYGICQCVNCQKRFKKMFGHNLPQKEDKEDPIYRKYLDFQKKTIQKHQKKVYNFVKEINPDICIANNFYQRAFVRQESNTAMDRSLPHWQYSASDNTDWVVSSYPNMISSNTTVDFIDFPYRHAAVSPHQQKLRLAQNLAHGGELDYYLIGRLDNHKDRSGFKPVKDMFYYHAEHEDEYKNLTSKSDIALLRKNKSGEYRGWFRFLAEHHYLFDVLLTKEAANLNWDKYKAIIIPDIEPLIDELIEELDNYAEDGGIIIASGKSGFKNINQEARECCPLKCLGLNEIKTIRSDMRSSYFQIDNTKKYTHLSDTELVYMDDEYVYVDYNSNVEKHLKLIPPHNYGPPERCYYEIVTEHPGFTVNSFDKGTGIYIPWKPGALFHRQGHLNSFDFIGDLLENFAGLKPVKGNFSRMVEVTLLYQEERNNYLLHLVNTSGHFGTSFYSPATMSEIEVEIDLPIQVSSVEGLVSEKKLNYNQNEKLLKIDLPELQLFEAIKINSKNEK